VENEFDFDTRQAKIDFSLLLLAIGQAEPVNRNETLFLSA